MKSDNVEDYELQMRLMYGYDDDYYVEEELSPEQSWIESATGNIWYQADAHAIYLMGINHFEINDIKLGDKIIIKDSSSILESFLSEEEGEVQKSRKLYKGLVCLVDGFSIRMRKGQTTENIDFVKEMLNADVEDFYLIVSIRKKNEDKPSYDWIEVKYTDVNRIISKNEHKKAFSEWKAESIINKFNHSKKRRV